MDLQFNARVWSQESTGTWHFVTLPVEASNEIHAKAVGVAKPFGTLRVVAKIGRSRWKTSIFWDRKRGAYLLPVKAAVRLKEQLRPGEEATVIIEVEIYDIHA